MKTAKVILVLLLMSRFSFYAQEKKNASAHMVWLGYFNSVKLGSRFSVNSDFQLRTRNNLYSQYIGRTGLVYGITGKVFVSAGFAAFFYPQAFNQNLVRKEWRPWEEIMFSDNVGRLKIQHRFRAEQRYNEVVVKNDLTDDYNYNHRFRYKFDLQYPVVRANKNSHIIILAVGNEIMINAEKIIKYNYFDQDRLYAGINYVASSTLTFQLQLMSIWQQQSNGYTFEKDKVLRFNIYHVINGNKNSK